MRVLDSRRLTGPNLLWDRPGAVLDVAFDGADAAAAIRAWRTALRALLAAVGWRRERCCVRRYADGASLAFSAPPDALYAAVDLNEAAWEAACTQRPVAAATVKRLRKQVNEQTNPRLRALLAAARRRSVPGLLDTEALSLGLGARSQTWPLAALPAARSVPWARLGRVPVALVTGTNGKTTTVRLLAAIGRAAGLCTGVSSTDWLAIDDTIIERDDYAGPEGARRILRDPRTEFAVLETARGGLLRRGLALERADAALITNVAADHIGEFGVQDLEELADVKWIVSRAIGADGTLVLNADDPRLVARGSGCGKRVLWFSPDPHNPVLRAARAAGATVCTLLGGAIVLREGRRDRRVIAVRQVPVALGGAARHNVTNALGSAALAHALGLPRAAIARGLAQFSAGDNPGRANLFTVGGVRVLVDFAHNPHGVRAAVDVAARLGGARTLLVIGQAGDRSDADIRELARASEGLRFDRVLIKRLDRYRRGRAAGETARLLGAEFRRMGYPRSALGVHRDELGAVRSALRRAAPGDLCLLLVHENRDAVLAWLRAREDSAAREP